MSNWLSNPDFSTNTTGVTSWNNSGWSSAAAIDDWSIVHAILDDLGGAVRVTSVDTSGNGYLIQLIPEADLTPYVGQNFVLKAVVDGVTYTTTGTIDAAYSHSAGTEFSAFGSLYLYHYPNDNFWHGAYAVSIEVYGSKTGGVVVSDMFFDIQSEPRFDRKSFLSGLAVGRQLKGWATLHYELPTHIEVLTPPTLREYADGAALDFTGLEVVLRKDDGGRYTDRNYPDGVVPMSELTFPVMYALYDGTQGRGAGEYYLGETLACRSLYCEERDMTPAEYDAKTPRGPVARLFMEGRGYGEWFIFWNRAPFRVAYMGNGHFLAAAECDLQGIRCGEMDTGIGVSTYSSTSSYTNTPKFTYDGKTVYYLDLAYYRSWLDEPYLDASEVVNPGAAAWAMVFGGLGAKQPIPVEWTAPLTKFPALPTMRDTFSIFVHETT